MAQCGTNTKFFGLISLIIVALLWSGLSPFGLKVDFFDDLDLSRTPFQSSQTVSLETNDRILSGDFIKGARFSIHYHGYVLILKKARYRFRLTSSDDAYLKIDGQFIVRTWEKQGLHQSSEGLELTVGFHPIEIGFFDQGGYFSFKLDFKTSFRDYSAIPFFLLYPGLDCTLQHCAFSVFFVLLVMSWLIMSIYHLRTFWQTRTTSLSFKLVTLIIICVSTALLWHNVALMRQHRQKAVHGCDTYGYLQAAIQMTKNGFTGTSLYDPAIPPVFRTFTPTVDPRELVFFQGPHAYYIDDFQTGKLVNQYPPGFPALIALVYFLKGEAATYFINIWTIVALSLSVLLFFARFQQWTIGMIGALCILYEPILFEHSILLMSDIPSAFLICLSCILAYSMRSNDLKPLITGTLTGLAILIRYSNFLLFIPLTIILLKKGENRPRQALFFFLSLGLSGLVPLLLYHNAVFGSPWRITYAFTNTSKVALTNVFTGLSYYGSVFLEIPGPAILLLALSGLLLGIYHKKYSILCWAICAFCVSHLLYISTNAILLPRYLVPIIPLLILLGGIALYHFYELIIARPYASIAILIVFSLFTAHCLLNAAHFPWAADRKPEENSYKIGQHTQTNARILADDLTGALRIYGQRFGYRALHIPYPLLQQSLEALLELDYPLYLAVDSNLLWQLKRNLTDNFQLELVQGDTGVPLYRILPKTNNKE